MAIALFVAGIATSLPAQDLTPASRPRAFERVEFDVDRFTEQSDVIVRGIVSSKDATWVDKTLYTQYSLVVQETIQGDPQPSVTMAVLGGTDGNIGLHVPGAPNFNIGDELILFGRTFEGHKSFKPVGLSAGVVPVTRARGRVSPTIAARGKPEGLDQFLAEVRSKRRTGKREQ